MTNYHRHIAVIPFPFSSHPASLLNVTKHLATNSVGSVNIHFTFFGTPKSNAPLSNNDDNNIIKFFDMVDGIPPTVSKVEGGIKAIDQEVGFFMRGASESVRNAVAQAEIDSGRKITCIIGDPFLSFLPDMAQEMRVPWVACWVSGLHSLQTHVYTDLIREKFGVDGPHNKDERLSFVPGLSNLRLQDLPDGVVSGDLQSPFAEMLRRVGKLLSRATAVIANSFEELDPDLIADLKSNINPNFLCTGPFNLITPPPIMDPHRCLDWLDHQSPRSVVYIGFGNITCPSPPEMAAIAAALEETNIKFLWSLKPDKISSCLPASFVDKVRASADLGMFVPWAPQIAVLEHPAIGVHMTHFGWNSVTESISGGVPMIGRPSMADQPVYARMAEAAWGVAMVVADDDHEGGGVLTKSGLKWALEKMFKDGQDETKNKDYEKY